MDTLDKPLARPRRPALIAGSAAVAGCAIAQAGLPSWAGVLLFAAAAVCCAGALFASRRMHTLTSVLAFAGVACAFAAYASARQAVPPDDLAAVFPEEAELVRVEGVIVEGGDYMKRDPAAFEYPESPQPEPGFPVGADPRRNVAYLLRVERLPDMERDVSGFVKIYAPPETDIALHTRISVVGKLRRPRKAGNPGEIDSRDRYAGKGITHTLTLKDGAGVQELDPPHPWDPRRFAPWVHEQFHHLIGSRMPRERAAVLGAAILGERGGLTPSQRSKFVRSGTIHLLVVSGMHVALLAGAVLLILRSFGMDPRKAWAVAAAAALMYLVITGIQPSMLRATVMVVIYALGKIILRRPDALNVLGASALVSLAIMPGDVADLGFQLSYLCVLGILVVAPCLRLRRPLTDSQRAARTPVQVSRDWIAASLRVSFAVGLCTWPLLAYSVHIVSPSMLITNLLVGPLLSAILLLALFTPLAVVPFVAAALAWLLSTLAGLLELLAGTFAELPGGYLFMPAPPEWWLVGYYAALALLVAGPRLRLPRILGAAGWFAWLCLLPALSLASAEEPGPARITALDVGQGQCVVFEVAGGPCAVLDCGSTSLGGVGERVLAPYLWNRGRRHIDILFISHTDADHVNGLPQLFERFPVGRVYVPETFQDDETGVAMTDWLSGHTEVRVLKRGDEVPLAEGLSIRCLWPDASFVKDVMPGDLQRNEGGLVLEVHAGTRRILLPSDVEANGLAGVMPLLGRVDVLFAPHQGSAVEGIDSLVSRLKPEHIMVSARETFPAESAMEAYRASGATIWRTWDHGAVTMSVGADGSLVVTPFLDE
jgi:competence protein ComEC